jgi:hypothetical protein
MQHNTFLPQFLVTSQSKNLSAAQNIMRGDWIYVCNIRSANADGRQTECVNRTLKKENFLDHLRDKHGKNISLKEPFTSWKQKRGKLFAKVVCTRKTNKF